MTGVQTCALPISTAEVVEESKQLMAARGGDTVADMMNRDFTFALDLLVAGIEAMVKRDGDKGIS